MAFGLLVPTAVYGVEGYWINNYGKQLNNNPTVCFLQPSDSRINEQRWNEWFSDMTTALNTWESVLNQSDTGFWKINIVNVPLQKISLLNPSTCDVTVKFTDESNPTHPDWLGWFVAGTGKISIVYSNYEYCGKEFLSNSLIMVDRYCFGDDIERSKRMASVLQHEFGHALGMGHYVSDNANLTQQWYDGIDTPSIMAFQHPDEELKNITQIDVTLIHEIYGEWGFGNKIDSIPVFNEPYVPEPVAEVLEIIQVNVIEHLEVIEMISGQLPDELYKKGIIIEVSIQKPDGIIEYEGIPVSKTFKSYGFPLSFDYLSQIGTHYVTLKADGEIFKQIIIIVSQEQPKVDSDKDIILDEINQKEIEVILKNISETQNNKKLTSVDNIDKHAESCFLFWCW